MLLDRIFGTLPFPWDIGLPALLWLVLCVALLKFAAPRSRRLAGWIALGNAMLWSFLFACFALFAVPPVVPGVLVAIEAPFGGLWWVLDELLWRALGLSGPGSPRSYFAETYDWPDGWLPVAAGLANQCVLLALLAFPIQKFRDRPRFS